MSERDHTETAATDPAPPGAVVPAVGEQVGRYRVDGVLGEGGMGVVLRAFDPDLEREIALKLLRPASSADESRGRLLAEARTMAKLRHPHVVAVHDVGTHGGRDFVAMELVPGTTLGGWLRTPRAPRDILAAFIAAGRGLAAAHAAGVIHRDFKPGNVLVGDDGRIAVSDFGVAIAASGDDGAVAGTPAYMAPEQRAGAPVDARADQFAFCVALHEALAGARPFPKNTAAEVLAGPPPLRAAVSARVKRAIARGLAGDREARHRSMDALLAELAPPPRRLALALLGVALIAAVAVAAFTMTRGTNHPVADDPCAAPPMTIDAPTRAAISAALASRPEARDTVLAGLDAYARRWTARRADVCAAARGPGFREAVACLLDARDEASTLAASISSDGAVAAVQALPDPARCSPDGVPALPDDPALRDRVRAVASELARLRGGTPSIAEITKVVDDARGLGYPPLVADAELALGSAEAAIPDVAAARRDLALAAVDAEAAGADDVRADALVATAVLEITYSSDHDAAALAAKQASAAVERRRDPRQRAALDAALGELAFRDGDAAGAIADLDQATTLDAQVGLQVDAARHRVREAAMLGDAGDPTRGLALVETTLADLTASLGPDDPVTVDTLLERAQMYFYLGRYDEAHADLLEANRRLPHLLPDGAVTLAGRVVDAAGHPVAGADVIVSPSPLHGDGGYAAQPEPLDRIGARQIESDRDGRFVAHVDPGHYLVIAEAQAAGRSAPRWLDAAHDVDTTVRLAGWATVQGRLTGTLPPDAHVHLIPDDGGDYHLEVRVVDGGYRARVGAGRYTAQVISNETTLRRIFAVAPLEIVAGAVRTLDFTVPAAVDVTIHARGAHDEIVASAAVGLVAGRLPHPARTLADLAPLMSDQAVTSVFTAFTTPETGGSVATLTGVPAGAYTLCIAAVSGDLRDPAALQRVLAHTSDLPVHCELATIAASPAKQELTATVP